MWNEELLCSWIKASETHCALVLRREQEAWTIFRAGSDGTLLPCRKTQDAKTALRHMGDMYRRSAQPLRQTPMVAHADALYDAAYLAAQIGQSMRFALLDAALGTVLLLYSGSLRTSPLV